MQRLGPGLGWTSQVGPLDGVDSKLVDCLLCSGSLVLHCSFRGVCPPSGRVGSCNDWAQGSGGQASLDLSMEWIPSWSIVSRALVLWCCTAPSGVCALHRGGMGRWGVLGGCSHGTGGEPDPLGHGHTSAVRATAKESAVLTVLMQPGPLVWVSGASVLSERRFARRSLPFCNDWARGAGGQASLDLSMEWTPSWSIVPSALVLHCFGNARARSWLFFLAPSKELPPPFSWRRRWARGEGRGRVPSQPPFGGFFFLPLLGAP